ncbi:MAG: aspartate dehydrogenase [Euryarchaeota archaeon]|nr:aspartate dehydrogenase [Euryarchaeota archaeon]
MLKMALIGCGSIGRIIAGAVCQGEVRASLVMVLDRDKEAAGKVCELLEGRPAIAGGVEEILASDADMVVEAASVEAAKEVAVPVLESGKDLMLLSVGALADGAFYRRVLEAARDSGRKVYIPSGAIGGLDALKSAMVAQVEEVTLTTTKNPRGLAGAPYLEEQGIDAGAITEKRVVFEGSAAEAIKGFPANTNVAVALGVAGIGVERTRVRVVADPGATRNVHEIHVRGDFGQFTFRVENLPSPHNPKTSYLAGLSAVATLKRLTSPFQVGT